MNESGLCNLIDSMQGVFQTLRVLAFVGAGFVLANMAWGLITTDGKTTVMETLKSKGIPMLVGFALLFAIGIGISFLMGSESVGCAEKLKGGW
ncbi:MAG: hypothetical protein LBJ73_00370 [Rickettsiales bacterium]|jgi:NADH:ubiquinone oxidoreductase subunit 6 (subunit J)|nr:hypothetical protein [Rickettsiales bacterium]